MITIIVFLLFILLFIFMIIVNAASFINMFNKKNKVVKRTFEIICANIASGIVFYQLLGNIGFANMFSISQFFLEKAVTALFLAFFAAAVGFIIAFFATHVENPGQ